MLKVYAYKGCDTCRKALKWLDANKIAYEVVPVREQPPAKKELEQMLGVYEGNLRKLFNTSGLDYKALNLKEKLQRMGNGDAMQMLARNGNLVRRPFVVTEQGGVVGFDEAEWKQLFGVRSS